MTIAQNGGSAELIGEQIVTLQLGEGPRALPLSPPKIFATAIFVVVENPLGNATEVREGWSQ